MLGPSASPRPASHARRLVVGLLVSCALAVPSCGPARAEEARRGRGAPIAGVELEQAIDTIRPRGGETVTPFRRSLTTDGDLVAVAIPEDVAQLFRRGADGSWEPEAILEEPGPRERPTTVALEGNVLAVGYPFADGANRQAGKVSVYHRGPSGAWERATELRPGRPEDGGLFGQAIALDGTTLAVSAPGAIRNQPGTVSVFRRGGDGWTLREVIRGDPTRRSELAFGTSLDLDDGVLAVGAPHQRPSQSNGGSVFVYALDETGRNRSSVEVTSPEAFAPVWAFGSSVSVAEGTLAVGTFEGVLIDGAYRGAVFVYRGTADPAGGWRLVDAIIEPAPEDDPAGSRFGTSVAVGAGGGTVLVGAPGSGVCVNVSCFITPGAAYLYEPRRPREPGGPWELAERFLDPQATPEMTSNFGLHVALGDAGVFAARTGFLTESPFTDPPGGSAIVSFPPRPPAGTELPVPGPGEIGAQLRIGNGSDPHVVRREPCIPETLCVSGAVGGRPEAFLRIVGPKPNGRLWPTLVKFSTARIEVWLTPAGGETKYYLLPGAVPGSTELPGLFDRGGFDPL